MKHQLLFVLMMVCHCLHLSAEVVVLSTPDAVSFAVLTINGPSSICMAANVQYSSNVAGGVWSSSDPGIATIDNSTGLANAVAAGTTTISYTAVVSGSPSTATLLVTVNARPNATIAITENNVVFNQFTNAAYYNASYTDGILCTGPLSAGPTTSATMTAGGGGNYLWSNNATTAAITTSTAGIYTVVVTNAAGCQSTISQTIAVNAAPNAGTISATPPTPLNSNGAFRVCLNATITLNSTVPGGIWEAVNKFPSPQVVSIDPLTGLVMPLVSTINVDTHLVIYRVTTNGCKSSTFVTTEVLEPPNAGTISGTTSVCAGSTTQLSSNGTTAVNTIRTWSSDNAGVATVNPSTGLVTGVAQGTATITYTVTNFIGSTSSPIILCTSTTTTLVTVTAAPNAGTISGTTTLCAGATTQLSSNGTGGGTWSSSNTGAATVNASGLVSGVAGGTSTITYIVTANGCASSSTSVLVTVNNVPNAGVISGTMSVCAGFTTQLSSNGIGGGTWSSSNPAAATVNASGLVSGLTSGMTTITYTVTANGCSSSASAVVTVNAIPNAGVISGTTSVCAGFTTQLSSNGAGGGSWSSSNPAAATVNASGLVSGLASGMSTITYMVTSNGCSSSASAVVTVNAIPNAGVISGTTSVCAGFTTQLSSNGAAGGSWSSSNPTAATVNASGLVSGLASGMSTITYMVTSNGCSSNASAVVTVNAIPNAGVISGTTSFCAGFTTQLSSNGVAGGTWSSNNPAAATVNASGLVSGQTSGMCTITYIVTSNGCSSSASAVVTVNAIPNAGVISGTTSVCAGSTTQLSSNGAGGGTWSSNNPAVATVNASGLVSGLASGMTTITYAVTSNGCSSSATAVVTVNTCNATFDGRILWSRNGTTGVKDVSVAVSGSASGSTITPASGLYAITVSPGSNFTITPAKNINLLNGVNAQDVWRINQHLSASPVPLTDPMDWIAADVNGNNTITPLDASIIQMSLLNNPQAIAQWTSSWRFVPASYALSLPPWGFPESVALNGSASNVNFYGIKVGDVVSAFANPANGMENPFVLRTPDQLLEAGRTIQADFSADALEDIAALQCALHFDPTRLQLEQVTTLQGLPLAAENFGANEAGSGTLRLLWAAGEGTVGLKRPTPVFRLHFKALESGSRLSEVLGLDAETLAGRVYNSREAEASVELRFDASTAANTLPNTAGLQLLQNQPNPFVDQTRIGFVLPGACEAQLRIFDAAGRLVTERTKQYSAGRHDESVELPEASGLFYYELTTPFGVLTKKMTKVN